MRFGSSASVQSGPLGAVPRAVRALVVLLLASISGPVGASGTPENCICFEHVGIQDKPMPDFCLSSRDCTACAKTETETLVLPTPEWASVQASLRPAAPPGFGQRLGDYIARAPDGSAAGAIDGEAMRGLVRSLIASAERRNAVPAPLLLRLQARLQDAPH